MEKFIPNLILPGAPKCGTSSLHQYLNQHPDISMSTIKEPHLYSRDDRYDLRFDQDYYRSFNTILKNANSKYKGESSTSYMPAASIVSKRIYTDNPDVKFIILLRDPIERIESHYNWLRSFDDVDYDIMDEVLKDNAFNYNPNNDISGNYKSYIYHSQYAAQLKSFLNHFNKNQFLILTTEDLLSTPNEVLKRCYDFLGVKKFVADYNTKSNQTQIQTVRIPRFIKKVGKDFNKNSFLIKKIVHPILKTSFKTKLTKQFFTETEKEKLRPYFINDIKFLKTEFDLNVRWKNFPNE